MSDYGQPNYGQPNYGQPNYGQPQGQPNYGQPQGQPNYGQPQGQPNYGQPGWQQGPPPGQPGYGPPPGGYPQQGPGGYGPGGPGGYGPGGYGPGGYGPPPKSRAGLIIGIVVALVLIGGGIGLAVGLSGGGGTTKDTSSAEGTLETFTSALNNHDAGALKSSICADTTDREASAFLREPEVVVKAAQNAKVLTKASGSGSAATGIVQATGGTGGKTETSTVRAHLKKEGGAWCIDSFDDVSGGSTTQHSGAAPVPVVPPGSVTGGAQGGSSAPGAGETDSRAKAVLNNFVQFLDHHDADQAKALVCGDAIGRAAKIKTLPQTNFDRIVKASVTSVGSTDGDVTTGHIDITDNDGPQDYTVSLHHENDDWCVYDL